MNPGGGVQPPGWKKTAGEKKGCWLTPKPPPHSAHRGWTGQSQIYSLKLHCYHGGGKAQNWCQIYYRNLTYASSFFKKRVYICKKSYFFATSYENLTDTKREGRFGLIIPPQKTVSTVILPFWWLIETCEITKLICSMFPDLLHLSVKRLEIS